MKNKLIVLSIVSTLLVGGCSSGGLREVSHVRPTTVPGKHVLDAASHCDDASWLPYRTCGYHFFECPHNNPWANNSRQVVQAVRNFEYALMSSNTYRKDKAVEIFVIPKWQHMSRQESDSGLGLDVYHRYNLSTDLVEIAIAYEGTNFTSIADWQYNFAIFRPNQFQEALEHAQKIRKENPNIPITVTGHSLGGGIALNISMHVKNTRGIAFNSSPRAFFGSENQDNGNERIHIYEVGEILGPLTRTYLRARLSGEQMLSVRYNFLDFTNATQAISEHTMYYLARGLMLVAIKGDSTEAAEAFIANIGASLMDSDKKYCDFIKNRREGA